jgi:hypothetical protein
MRSVGARFLSDPKWDLTGVATGSLESCGDLMRGNFFIRDINGSPYHIPMTWQQCAHECSITHGCDAFQFKPATRANDWQHADNFEFELLGEMNHTGSCNYFYHTKDEFDKPEFDWFNTTTGSSWMRNQFRYVAEQGNMSGAQNQFRRQFLVTDSDNTCFSNILTHWPEGPYWFDHGVFCDKTKDDRNFWSRSAEGCFHLWNSRTTSSGGYNGFTGYGQTAYAFAPNMCTLLQTDAASSSSRTTRAGTNFYYKIGSA